jgi:hypothetical protein
MKFIHLPVKDSLGNLARFGGMSIGYEYADAAKKELFVTFARCSERDVFNKAKSRLICKGRMEKGKFLVLEKPKDVDLYVFLKEKAYIHDLACQEGKGLRQRGGILGKT